MSYFRQLWIRFFEHLGYVTYHAADDIIALYEANREKQFRLEARHLSAPLIFQMALTWTALRHCEPKEPADTARVVPDRSGGAH